MDKNIEQIISLLQQGKQLPAEYQDILFPVNHKEYELTYKGKMPKEQVLAVGEEPQGVPFQIEKVFGERDIDDWQNLLIFGDNFQALKTMFDNKDELIKNKVKGKVKLIYIDPPFATEDEFVNKDGAKAYSDKIKGAEFIEFIRQRLIVAREILSNDGSIFVHLDNKMVHYIKIVMDEVFGKNNFQREIIWQLSGISGYKSLTDNFIRGHDTILYYSKSETRIFNKEFLPYSKEQLKRFSSIDENGRQFKTITKERRKYLDEAKGIPVADVWLDIASFQTIVNSPEIMNYPTQKPEKLLERIIKSTTNEGDLVMDFFAGSGTTLNVAERLNRRWIGVDIGKLAIYTTQKRLLTLPNRQPFAVVNAGCYDLKKVFEMERQKYVDFVSELFQIEKASKKISGVLMDGKRRGDWVKIYEWQDFVNNAAVDENFINELHKTIGEKIGEKFYIVAPELNFDIVGDYYKPIGSNTKYFFLKIPYQYIKDLHKIEFKKLNQPKSKDKINSIDNSIGFYFNEVPQIESHIEKQANKIVLYIDNCISETIQADKENILATVLIDSTNDKNFIMQDYFFADEIKDKTTGKYKIEIRKEDLKSNKLKVVYIDIFGNEFVEVLEVL
ncbi:MAG TPA: site-specific DNA-methyltransferase [Oscillospiraceae bacterium]|nr:site-specific DNA-methyltransferase [Oscillospiraceae bacterium]HPS34456.1 site-specific DNA-methyltransferase [Oscillospiraceae bacterium]